MPEAPDASGEGEEEGLSALEEEVFSFLLKKPSLLSAVDLACGGKWEEAVSAFDKEIRELLKKAPQPAKGPEETAAQPPPAGVPAQPAAAEACQRLEEAADKTEKPAEGQGEGTVLAEGADQGGTKRPREDSTENQGAGQEWLAKSQKLLEEEAKRKEAAGEEEATASKALPVPLYWKVDLPEVSKMLAKPGKLLASHAPVEHPHVTLLYIGGKTDDSQAAQSAGLPLSQFVAMRQKLEALRDTMMEVQITEVVIEENVICAMVSLPANLPCANEVPHITLGTKAGVPARYAHQVLQEIKGGRKDGVTTVPLPAPKRMRGRVMLQTSAA